MRKLNNEDLLENTLVNKEQSPRIKHDDSLRNKRFLTFQELIHLVDLTIDNDMADVFKEYIRLEENEDIIHEASNLRKKPKSKIQFNFLIFQLAFAFFAPFTWFLLETFYI